MGFLKKLFGWQTVKAGIDELEQQLDESETPSLDSAAKVISKRLQQRPCWVGIWSWSLQEWITIHGSLPAGFDYPCETINGIAEFYMPSSQR